jgi:hypothetical protein
LIGAQLWWIAIAVQLFFLRVLCHST